MRAPAILGRNLIKQSMEGFIHNFSQTALELDLFECPVGVDPLYFSTLCVYFYTECEKVLENAKSKVQRDASVNSVGVGDSSQSSFPSSSTKESTQPKPSTSGSKKNQNLKNSIQGDTQEKSQWVIDTNPYAYPLDHVNFWLGQQKGFSIRDVS